ncbi:hypothetical protein M0812_11767 [Anaeramoeba flamelloides]|uniref:Transmembrane protein n=1 Tax=Anaeramoeba flamelloides TaxID=1746091 RepID=A0AAV7ZXH6_9EUKA|nr:hypothetical protein M0812_11767 [Anaeramoeba flamelloides]
MSEAILKIKKPSKIPKEKLLRLLNKGGFDVDTNLDHQSLVQLFLRIQEDLQAEIESDSSEKELYPPTIYEIEQEKILKNNKKEKGKNNPNPMKDFILDLNNYSRSDSDSDLNSSSTIHEEEEKEEEKNELKKKRKKRKNDPLLTPPNSKAKKNYLGSYFTGSNSLHHKNSSRLSRKKYRTERIQRKRPYEENNDKFKKPKQPNFYIQKKRFTNKQKKGNNKFNTTRPVNKENRLESNFNSEIQYQQQEAEQNQLYNQPEIEIYDENPTNFQSRFPEEHILKDYNDPYIAFPQHKKQFSTQTSDDQEMDDLTLSQMNKGSSSMGVDISYSDEIGINNEISSQNSTNQFVYSQNYLKNDQNYETQASWFLKILIILFGMVIVLCIWYLSENYLK